MAYSRTRAALLAAVLCTAVAAAAAAPTIVRTAAELQAAVTAQKPYIMLVEHIVLVQNVAPTRIELPIEMGDIAIWGNCSSPFVDENVLSPSYAVPESGSTKCVIRTGDASQPPESILSVFAQSKENACVQEFRATEMCGGRLWLSNLHMTGPSIGSTAPAVEVFNSEASLVDVGIYGFFIAINLKVGSGYIIDSKIENYYRNGDRGTDFAGFFMQYNPNVLMHQELILYGTAIRRGRQFATAFQKQIAFFPADAKTSPFKPELEQVKIPTKAVVLLNPLGSDDPIPCENGAVGLDGILTNIPSATRSYEFQHGCLHIGNLTKDAGATLLSNALTVYTDLKIPEQTYIEPYVDASIPGDFLTILPKSEITWGVMKPQPGREHYLADLLEAGVPNALKGWDPLGLAPDGVLPRHQGSNSVAKKLVIIIPILVGACCACVLCFVCFRYFKTNHQRAEVGMHPNQTDARVFTATGKMGANSDWADNAHGTLYTELLDDESNGEIGARTRSSNATLVPSELTRRRTLYWNPVEKAYEETFTQSDAHVSVVRMKVTEGGSSDSKEPIKAWSGVHQAPSIAAGLDFIADQLDTIYRSNRGWVFDKFQIGDVETTRRGGQAVVAFARSNDAAGEFALKFFACRDAFANEHLLYTNSALRDIVPDIADLYGNEDGVWKDPLSRDIAPCVVLEKGQPLDEWVRQVAPDTITSIQMMCHVIKVVADIHAAGLVHRDLKPGNTIWLESRKGWTVIDYGSAARHGETALLSMSLAYAAPETMAAFEGKQRQVVADRAVDVWALGVMAFELFTGTRVFPVSTTRSSVSDALRGREKLPWEDAGTTVHAELMAKLGAMRRGVLQMLQRDPSKRLPLSKVHAMWTSIFSDPQ